MIITDSALALVMAAVCWLLFVAGVVLTVVSGGAVNLGIAVFSWPSC